MILFLDVISSIPEFSVINDNKIVFSCNIIRSEQEKLSENIIPCYLELNKYFSLGNKLKGLMITIGPGSYTALRVGAAFLTGLQYSKNLNILGVSSETILNLLTNHKNLTSKGIYLNSANSQNFLSYKDSKNNFVNYKIETDKLLLPKKINKIYYNENPLKINFNNIHQVKFSFKEVIQKNLQKINLNKKEIIKPIYISNNTTLN